MLFQEKPDVALLEFNQRKEGPIFEDDKITMKAVVNNHIKSSNKPVSFSFILNSSEKQVVLELLWPCFMQIC